MPIEYGPPGSYGKYSAPSALATASTTVQKNPGNDAMKALALALFPSMEWRHHGIGVLQEYVIENSIPEVRLHVWAPELMKPGIHRAGDIHDHRFDLVSHVLCGDVGHEVIDPEPAEQGGWEMLSLTHARAAKENAYHGPTSPLPGRFAVRRTMFVIKAGHTYSFPQKRFHRSPVLPGVAVTCVEKHSQTDSPARILYPASEPPVMAFGHEMDWAVIGPVLQRARELLGTPVQAGQGTDF